jgi:voltage-gated potassium channel
MPYSEEQYRGDVDRLPEKSFKRQIFIIIFGTNTRAGKLFDVVLLWLIVLSVLAVMLETVDFIAVKYGTALRILEWVVTVFFTIEYIARIAVVSKPAKYIFSWLGIIDLLALLPSYLSVILAGSQGLLIIRALRLIRVFRVLKLMRFVSEAEVLGRALTASRHKITVFFFFLMILVFILGSIMYLIEGPERGFNSIPLSIYWAIVTLTTVGFGDITPQTVVGQMIASIVMLLGYAIIAIPTGIVGAEIYKEKDTRQPLVQTICPSCGKEEHLENAAYCHKCGDKLIESST